jgi:hypothetical protein
MRRRGPATRSGSVARCRRAATAGIARTPMPRARTWVARPAPRRTSPYPPPDPVDQLPLAPLRWPARLLALGQQRLQHRPLLVGQVRPCGHGYGVHEISGVDGRLGRRFIYRRSRYLSINDTPTTPSPDHHSRPGPPLKHGIARPPIHTCCRSARRDSYLRQAGQQQAGDVEGTADRGPLRAR